MDIENRRIWQQAAGDTDRNYVQVCKDFDVILNGPGRYGRWPECQSRMKQDKWGRKITDLRRFSEEMKSGDLVVLKLGTREVHAVGEVDGSYDYHQEFGDVDGWDLEHIRRVRWLWRAAKKPKEFPLHTLKFGDTTQLVDTSKVELMTWLKKLDLSEVEKRPLSALPVSLAAAFQLTDLAELLREISSTAQTSESLLAQLRTLIDLASWYSQTGEAPSEYETVSNLVQPLLRLLGWSHQQMAIEWKNIDVALFAKSPRRDSNLIAILEAKRRGRSCLHALPQAEEYARTRPSCQRLILTDGIRYWVYVKRGDRFDVYAHLNLKRLRVDCPVYRCAGAKDALRAMVPEWAGERV